MIKAKPAAESGHFSLLYSRYTIAVLFLFVAIALQISSFGNLNRHADETFYFLVGQRMHEGLLPYVDVWDRKPLGLFLIYYAIAAISKSVLAYQIAACIFAAATASVICALVSCIANRRGGVLAGLSYLIVICAFEGDSGQAPDFYNLFIVTAVWLVYSARSQLERARVGWPIFAAMGLCGIAITIKQTTLFEALFLGLVAPYFLLQAKAPLSRIFWAILISLIVGAMPSLLIAGYYFHIGHWAEFWHAMVTSNLEKARLGGEAHRAFGISVKAAPLLIIAALGLTRSTIDRGARRFIACWILAAIVGFLSVPNFFPHYALPLFVPLSVAAGFFFAVSRRWLFIFLGMAVYSLIWFSPFSSRSKAAGNQSMMEMANVIEQRDGGGGLLVFDAPPYLYALTGKRFLSPLVFPHHLSHQIENNVSHLDTHNEIDRILMARPGVIALAKEPRNWPVNEYSRNRILAYAKRTCSSQQEILLYEDEVRIPILIFGNCGKQLR